MFRGLFLSLKKNKLGIDNSCPTSIFARLCEKNKAQWTTSFVLILVFYYTESCFLF